MFLNICVDHVDKYNLEKLYTEAKVKSLGGSSNKIHLDSGVDLYCPDYVLVKPKETKFIDLGIKCSATSGVTGKDIPTAYYLYPRSSLSKTPLRLANSVGIIDSGYRGHIIAAVDNISDTEFMIKKGTRLFQICAPDLGFVYFNIVSKLDKTVRGDGCYGSTGE